MRPGRRVTPSSDALSRTVGLRNRIAHGYATRLWAEIPAGRDALERYAAAVARFVPPVTS